jgi:hypothetical protein
MWCAGHSLEGCATGEELKSDALDAVVRFRNPPLTLAAGLVGAAWESASHSRGRVCDKRGGLGDPSTALRAGATS